jgi:hypothetical protein
LNALINGAVKSTKVWLPPINTDCVLIGRKASKNLQPPINVASKNTTNKIDSFHAWLFFKFITPSLKNEK